MRYNFNTGIFNVGVFFVNVVHVCLKLQPVPGGSEGGCWVDGGCVSPKISVTFRGGRRIREKNKENERKIKKSSNILLKHYTAGTNRRVFRG